MQIRIRSVPCYDTLLLAVANSALRSCPADLVGKDRRSFHTGFSWLQVIFCKCRRTRCPPAAPAFSNKLK